MTMKNGVNIFWFRRDLRLEDNVALYYALNSNLPVLPIFIFDPLILDKLEDKSDRRVSFIHNALQEIQTELLQSDSSLLVLHKTPLEAFKFLITQYKIEKVFINHDYEPYAKERDEQISSLLKNEDIL